MDLIVYLHYPLLEVIVDAFNGIAPSVSLEIMKDDVFSSWSFLSLRGVIIE